LDSVFDTVHNIELPLVEILNNMRYDHNISTMPPSGSSLVPDENTNLNPTTTTTTTTTTTSSSSSSSSSSTSASTSTAAAATTSTSSNTNVTNNPIFSENYNTRHSMLNVCEESNNLSIPEFDLNESFLEPSSLK
jgi:hypothetical protein